MIGFILGKVLFSDGTETILQTNTGVGYQVYLNYVLAEGSLGSLYISHVIKENADDLYGFKSLRDKKMFEMLTSVKGVGPKSAYSLVTAVGTNQIIEAIQFETKKVLTKAPGVGAKAAAQMILDLSSKVHKIKMYSNKVFSNQLGTEFSTDQYEIPTTVEERVEQTKDIESQINTNEILTETVMACKELGFKEEKVISLAQKILNSNEITRSEQLVHLVLKEI